MKLRTLLVDTPFHHTGTAVHLTPSRDPSLLGEAPDSRKDGSNNIPVTDRDSVEQGPVGSHVHLAARMLHNLPALRVHLDVPLAAVLDVLGDGDAVADQWGRGPPRVDDCLALDGAFVVEAALVVLIGGNVTLKGSRSISSPSMLTSSVLS